MHVEVLVMITFLCILLRSKGELVGEEQESRNMGEDPNAIVKVRPLKLSCMSMIFL